uniref:Uncharacterized protein n=1 Tax=Arundo donax TaxID=35708 RepID=A0A0A9I3A7_ARUDO
MSSGHGSPMHNIQKGLREFQPHQEQLEYQRNADIPFLIAENEGRAQTHEKEFQHPHG